jgi:hypothetical protein
MAEGFRGESPTEAMDENMERRELSSDQPLSESIVRAVASAEGIEPEQVASRIYDSVDPDALDRLFNAPSEDIKRQDAQLFFKLDNHEVIIQGGELVIVRPIDSEKP